MINECVSAGTYACTALAKYQCTLEVPEMEVELTLFPLTNQLVVREPGCPVILLPIWPC
jgi:hypothetical protein